MSKNDYNDEEEEELLKSASFIPGEYELHLFIEETRELLNFEDETKTLDVIINCQAFDLKQNTSTKMNIGTGQTFWGEHLFFLKNIENESFLFANRLKINPCDYLKFGRGSLIGEVDIDLFSIYQQKNHALLHQWAAISNYAKNKDKVFGYIKFSVSLLGKMDKVIVLDVEAINTRKEKKRKSIKHIGKAGNMGANLLLPPNIKKIEHQIKITLIKAEDLVELDTIGSIDPYVVFEFGSARIQTQAIKDNKNPFWGKIIYLPYFEPNINNYLTVIVMDFDHCLKDDLLGTLIFSKEDIKEAKYQELSWFNIYGAHPDESDDTGLMMNKDSNLGNFWKGRIFLSIQSYQEDNPKLEIENIDENQLKILSASNKINYSIIFDIDSISNLPFDDTSHEVLIRWADKEIQFPSKVYLITRPNIHPVLKFKKADKNYLLIKEQKSYSCDLPYINSQELPDIIIYLVSDGVRLSYVKIPAKNYLIYDVENLDYHFNYLIPYRSNLKNKVRFESAGIIKIKMAILCECDKKFIENLLKKWKDLVANRKFKNGCLFANIYQARNVAPSDNTGSSDPFLTLSINEKTIQTKCLKESLNPVWYTRLKLPLAIPHDDDSPIFSQCFILLKMFDKDINEILAYKINDENEFLGSVVVELESARIENYAIFNSYENPKPKWIKLEYNKRISAEVLLSINIFDNDIKESLLPSLIPKTTKYDVQLKVLGLRDLKYSTFDIIRRPYLKINFSNSPNLKFNADDFLIINAKNGGCNPNFSSIIRFELNLPEDLLYCPSITCSVYDTALIRSQIRILGFFTIDLASLIEQTSKRANPSGRETKPSILFVDPFNPAKGDSLSNFEINEDMQNNEESGIEEKMIRKEGKNDTMTTITTNKTKKVIKPTAIELDMNLKEKKMKKKVNHKSRNHGTSLNNSVKIIDYIPIINKNGTVNNEYIVIMAKYSKNSLNEIVEKEIPNPNNYLSVGYDKATEKMKEKINKHYRYYVDKELEKTDFLDDYLFNEYDIMRGKRFNVDQGNFFENLFSFDEAYHKIGRFKGIINVKSREEEDKIKIFERGKLRTEEIDNLLEEQIIQPVNVIVRVYVLEVLNLPPMDYKSLSDPYIQIKLDNQTVNNADSYINDVTNAGIYKIFELKGLLPGASELNVQVWDHDNFNPDDLIGETKIDLENRFFCPKWRELSEKPIETRDLFHPSTSLPRGKIKLWLDILDLENISKKIKWNITPKPEMEFEVRVVIWECKNVPPKDVEGTSDVFIVGKLGDDSLNTDTHLKSNGYGSFNWRMKWKIKLPNKNNVIHFQIWDQDFLDRNDFIGETSINFEDQAVKAYETENSVKIIGTESLSFMKKMEKYMAKDPDEKIKYSMKGGDIFKVKLENLKTSNKNKKHPSLFLSFEILPFDQALKHCVGFGRSEPNHSPWLPPPISRVNLFFDQEKILKEIFNPEIKAKLIVIGAGVVCGCVIFILVIVLVASLIANALV